MVRARMEGVHLELPVVIGLLVSAVALAIAAKRVNVPYNVALVVGGMIIAVGGLLPTAPRLEPELVFAVCLPALLFEGGVSADLPGIRSNAVPIGTFAVPGMIIAVAVTGLSFSLLLGLPIISGLLLGAVLSTTDTVSILYAFRRAPVPPRLSAIMQGESLFNDGTALVAYATLVTVVTGGAVSVPHLFVTVFVASFGGIVVGLLLGLGGGVVVRWAEDPLTEIMTTTALAFGSYIVGEQLGVSGAIAAVTAGLTMGAALRRHASPPTQVAISSFWEYVTFGVNTFLFLSVGLSTRPESLLQHLPETGIAVFCVFLGRAVSIYLPSLVLGLVSPAQRLPTRWQHVFIIGNIKGALSIALAIGLPVATPHRASLIDVAFGVSFVSLVVQGLLLIKSLGWLGLLRVDPIESTIAEQQARLITARAARQELETLYSAGIVPRDGYERLRSDYQVTIAQAERELRRLHERHIAYDARVLLATRRRLMDAERTALYAARRAGLIPEGTAERIAAELDERTLALEQVSKVTGDST